MACRSTASRLLFAQGYDGLPTKASLWFGPSNYYESAAYVGVVALVLAVVAVLTLWRRSVVVALGATALVSVIVVYSPAVQPLFTKAALGTVATQRMLPMLAFSLAVLAGLGTEVLQRHWAERRAQMALLAGVAACAVVLGYLWLSSRTAGITPAELSIREHSLVWPAVTLAGMAATGLWAFLARSRRSTRLGDSAWASRAGRAGCLALLAAQSAYLVWAGIGLNSYSSAPFPVNQAVADLQRIVGNRLVALDGPNEADVTMWTGTGLYPEVNVGYKIRELAVHDPVMPPGYFKTWPVPGATARAGLGNNVFVPAVTSAAEARHYGASFILASLGRVPTGTHFVTSLGTAPYRLFLYRAPGAAQFSFAPGSQAGVLSATQVGNSTWHLAVRAPRASALTLRVTYLPGWHVSADGRPLSVREVGGLFAGVTVPAGTRSLVVEYWPDGLTAGFALALAALCALIVAVAAERALGRRTGRRKPPSP